MGRTGRNIVCLGVLLAAATVFGHRAAAEVAAEPPATKPAKPPRVGVRPVPAEAVQGDARKDLKQQYAKDFADVTDAGKRRLAGILMRAAAVAVSDGPLYVALFEARELACAVGEVELALEAAGEMSRQFDVEPESVRYATLVQCSQRKLSPAQSAALSQEAKSVAEARLAEDDFDGASRAASLAEEVSRRSGDPALQAQMALMADFLKEMLRQLPAFRAALAKLDKDPDDPAANQTAGEFLALVKQEWGRGLVMLTHGTDPQLKAAATLELSGTRGAELSRAADAWSKLAEKKTGPARLACATHARGLYEKALGDLTGIDAAACLERIAAAINALPANANLADPRAARSALGDAKYTWWEDARFGSLENRDDIGDLKNTQATVQWHPHVNDKGDVAAIPEGTGEPKETRLTYKLDQLVTDEQGRESVLQKSGKVTMKGPEKPIHLPGAPIKDLRKLNASKVTPTAIHVEIYLDGVKVYERVSKSPLKRAWWLDEKIVVKADKK